MKRKIIKNQIPLFDRDDKENYSKGEITLRQVISNPEELG